MIRCKRCGWNGAPHDADVSHSPYHDMKCPVCGTTQIDTSEINKAWAAEGKIYGYGDNNVLQMKDGING